MAVDFYQRTAVVKVARELDGGRLSRCDPVPRSQRRTVWPMPLDRFRQRARRCVGARGASAWRARRHATLESGESAERGRAARQRAPRATHGDWAPAPDRPDPVDAARRAGGHACAGARADPLRADARLAVHLLPRRGGDHGGGPRGDADFGHRRAGLRRRPHLELRRVRGAGPPAALQPQRLRRDAARPVGVGRQAHGRERRDRGPRRRAARPTAGAGS